MPVLKKGTRVKYSQAKAVKGPWRIAHHYGNDVYRIESQTEFCDMVPRSMLKPVKKGK